MLVATITALVVYEIAQMLFASTQSGYYYEYSGSRSLMHEFRFPCVGCPKVGRLAATIINRVVIDFA
jgi:hypothetical protein